MPTFSPGWKCVPRWRTMISPAATSCPPKRFTPRRFDSESRPFLELPPAFLCAISLASLLANDFGNPDFSVGLPMTEAAAIILASLELDHVDLGGAALGRHLAAYAATLDPGRADGHLAVVTRNQGYLVKFDRLALTGRELFEAHHFAGLDRVLLATGGDYRIHSLCAIA